MTDISTTCAVVIFLTPKVTTTQVVEMSFTVNNNSPIQDYLHRDNQTQYIDSCLNLLAMDTVFSPQGGCFGKVQMYYNFYVKKAII